MKQTTLCYLEKDGKYLMMHRVKKENDENKDKWIGIGGHIEDGESPHDCVIREIYEETGLSVLPEHCIYRGLVIFICTGYAPQYMHLFHVKTFSGTLRQDCREGDLEWIAKDMLLSLPMWEGDKLFLSLLDRHVPFFSLKLKYDGGTLLSHDLQFAGEDKKPLLISACLLGTPCRYDGQSRPLSDTVLTALSMRYTLIPVCPEQLGGLSVPRVPAERQQADGCVLRQDGYDVTAAYYQGAQETLRYAKWFGAAIALLKARSPSCGSGVIYDGHFTGTFREGDGVTAELLKQNGITVYTEETMEALLL